MCCFNSNIESLDTEDQKLKDDKEELRIKVSQEENNGRKILPAVETWFENTENWQSKITELKTLVPSVRSGCLNIISRYSLSKDAKKTSKAVQTHRGDRPQLDSIAYDPPLESIPQSETYDFQSRKQIEDDIMDSLKRAMHVIPSSVNHTNSENSYPCSSRAECNNVFGIVGMGGLGKTTMAGRIKDKMVTEKLVDKAVMVVISQPVDKLKIQLEMGELLGLKDIKKLHTVPARAEMLHARLKGRGRILLVLDDIWEALDLRELGIPSKIESTNCLLLLTSRNRAELTEMKADVFAMEILSKEDAMTLFKDKAGIRKDGQIPMRTVEDVVQECNGLPIALVTLGTALLGEKMPVWEDTLCQLKSSNPENLEKVLEHVYKPLHRSYEFLKTKEAKSLFLLCSLFPEDSNISFEMLTCCGMGLNMFNVDSLRDARNRVEALVSMLKKRSLLLDGEKENHVRMHDVVRDVAIFIASNEGRNRYWISNFPNSSKATLDLRMGCNSPELQLMIIHLESDISSDMETNEYSVLKGKGNLEVLSLKNFPSMPQSIELPKTLQTLHLVRCKLSSLSMVGELPNLKILKCDTCKGINELPTEIGQLTRLKLLHMGNCYGLKKIKPGILSKLVELEELYMLESFKEWESISVNEDERKNASLKELESLTKLSSLTIEVSKSNLVEEEIPHINVKNLTISECGMLENLIKLPEVTTEGVFPILEYLSLSYLPKLKQLCNSSISKESNSFKNLGKLILIGLPSLMHLFESADQYVLLKNVREMTITNCKELRNVFLLERAATEVISKLESLSIYNCEKMKEVMCNEESRKDGRRCVIQFQNLKEMILHDLSNLTTFGKGFESIEFPMLENLQIGGAPKLISLVSKDGHNDDDVQSSYCLFNNQVKFCRLDTLRIEDCNNIKGLFLTSIFQDLSNILRSLIVDRCQQMERVIVNENEMQETFVEINNESKKDEGAMSHHITFSNLEILSLQNLLNLMTFGTTSKIESIDCPLLKELGVTSCPKFKYKIISSESEDGYNLQDSDDQNESFQLFCNIKVKFNRLKCLSLDAVSREDFPTGAFKSLERLVIRDCDSVKSLFSKSIVQDYFSNLESLSIKRCKHLERVIMDEKEMRGNSVEKKNESKKDGEVIGGQHIIAFPKLQYLKLEDLPGLMTFSTTSEIESIEFPLLEDLKINNCPEFRYMIPSSKGEDDGHDLHYNGDNGFLHSFCNKKVKFGRLKTFRISDCKGIKSLFSISIVQDLSNICLLDVVGCQEMECVVVDENKIQSNSHEMKNVCKKDEEEKGRFITFPKLEHLKLKDLPGLLTFSTTSEIESIEFPLLERLYVMNCPEFRYMIPSSKGEDDGHNLQDNDDNRSLHVFCNKKIKFGRLITLEISNCNGIKSLFSISIVQDLSNLWLMEVKGCQEMECVIVDENKIQSNSLEMKNGCKKDEEEKGRRITFPKLEHLTLEDLPGLMTFSTTSEIESIEFPLLVNLWINNCPEFRYMIPSSKGEDDGHNLHDNDDNRSLHLFCNKKVKFDRLKSLVIRDCNGIKSLFSISIVQDLSNLWLLYVRGCQVMECVVVDENKIQSNSLEMKNKCKKDEEEKGRRITFPKLEHLTLINLSGLMTFSTTSEIESIEFPLLKRLYVKKCPEFRYMIPSSKGEDDGHNLHDNGDNRSLHLFCNKKENVYITDRPRMESLTRNLVITPKLREVYVDGTEHDVEKFGEIDDLNAFIRQHIKKESTSYEIEDERKNCGELEHGNGEDVLEIPPSQAILDDTGTLDSVAITGEEIKDTT